MIGYGTGECAYSLVMNGFFGFAMLYYTEALGLDPALAGVATAVAILWEIIMDPIMGYTSDRTRSRFGRRHPWIFAGGFLMVVCFYFLWAVPGALHGRAAPLFAWLLMVNLLLRTGVTLFLIPYMALGFEMYPDTASRAQIQAVRQVMNMAANLLGPALAWSLFLRDVPGADGTLIPGARMPDNFLRMGMTFALAAGVCVLASLWFTRAWIRDTRTPVSSDGIFPDFWNGVRRVLSVARARRIGAFIFLSGCGTVLASAFQPYLYVYFMELAPARRTIAHGATMLGMALGGVLSAAISRRLGKPRAIFLGGTVSILSNGALLALVLTNRFDATMLPSWIGFVLCHAAFWLGAGIMLPSGIAMMADFSADCLRRDGANREGLCAALLSLAIKASIAVGMTGAGWILRWIGLTPSGPQNVYSQVVTGRLGRAALLVGPLMIALALTVLPRTEHSEKGAGA
jgi:GPH family glycoside/pentoside/hexuronide:cation symporter